MIPVPPLVFLDANVLFSRTLRDWISLLALESDRTAYDLRFSEDVLAEWIYRIRRKKPEYGDQVIDGRRRELVEAFPGAMVIGYNPGSVLEMLDPNDQHVLAAVIHGEVDMLVADDRRAGFSAAAEQHGFDFYLADDFLMWVANNHGALVMPVLERQLKHYNKNSIVGGGRSAEDLISSLRKAKASSFAAHLEGLLGAQASPRAEPASDDQAGGLGAAAS